MQSGFNFLNLKLFSKTANTTSVPVQLDVELAAQVTNIGTFAKFKTTILDFDFAAAASDQVTALQQLHHLGALLINSGKAYSALLTGDNIAGKATAEDQLAMKNKLIRIYNTLPSIKDEMMVGPGHPKQFAQSAVKILHAHFVLRVALDHLPPEKIYKLYQDFMEQNKKFKLSAIFFSFADGSGFVGSLAAEQLLLRYICNNLMLFSFLSASQLGDIMKKESKYHELLCIGGASKRELINNVMYMNLTATLQDKCDSPQNNKAMRKE